jgi:hypothetical protein
MMTNGLAQALSFTSTASKAFGVRKQEFDRKHPRLRTIGQKAAVMIAWRIMLVTDNTITTPFQSETSKERLGRMELLGNISIIAHSFGSP